MTHRYRTACKLKVHNLFTPLNTLYSEWSL